MVITRNLGAVAAAIAVGAMTCSSAHAWTWASSGNMIKMNGGKGHGWTSSDGSFGAKMQAYLGDTKTGDGRVYATSGAQHGGQFISISSGLRTDGESAVVAMKLQTIDIPRMYTVHQYRGWTARLCREVPGPNKCSDDVRSKSGSIDS